MPSTGAAVAAKKTEPPKEELSFSQVMDKAAKSAIRGGTAGACAMGANVACLMWMRTTVRSFVGTYMEMVEFVFS